MARRRSTVFTQCHAEITNDFAGINEFQVVIIDPPPSDERAYVTFKTRRGAQAFRHYVNTHQYEHFYYAGFHHARYHADTDDMQQDYKNAIFVIQWLELSYPRILPYLVQLIDPKTFLGPLDLDESKLRKIGI